MGFPRVTPVTTYQLQFTPACTEGDASGSPSTSLPSWMSFCPQNVCAGVSTHQPYMNAHTRHTCLHTYTYMCALTHVHSCMWTMHTHSIWQLYPIVSWKAVLIQFIFNHIYLSGGLHPATITRINYHFSLKDKGKWILMRWVSSVLPAHENYYLMRQMFSEEKLFRTF